MKLTLILIIFLMIFGCAGKDPYKSDKRLKAKLKNIIDLDQSSMVKKKLLEQYSQWKGTRYKLGGLTKKGIDCSGFVYITFRLKLGIELPRSTKLLVKEGNKISKDQLRSGDLVFFKTGFFTRHVGIYLNNSKFLHASVRKGVIISNLKNSYWESKYWTSKRIQIQ